MMALYSVQQTHLLQPSIVNHRRRQPISIPSLATMLIITFTSCPLVSHRIKYQKQTCVNGLACLLGVSILNVTSSLQLQAGRCVVDSYAHKLFGESHFLVDKNALLPFMGLHSRTQGGTSLHMLQPHRCWCAGQGSLSWNDRLLDSNNLTFITYLQRVWRKLYRFVCTYALHVHAGRPVWTHTGRIWHDCP